MRPQFSLAAALFAFIFVAPQGVTAANPTAGMTVGNFQWVSENRDTRTLFYETYQATLTNPGAAAANVTATVTSTSPYITVVPGQNVLQFSPVPANSQVVSSNTFTILVDRTQTISLSSLQFTFDNPVANAGSDQTATLNSLVTLNGSGSTNPTGQGTLTYSWAFSSVPTGSKATLSNPSAVMPTFTVDVAGTYSITLTVNNGLGTSSATVNVSTINSPPVANAGPNQSVAVGSTVYLDGSASSDVDGSPLSFMWQLISAPTGSGAFLSYFTTSSPSFIVDQPGTYVVKLVVTADGLNSVPVTVTITTNNTPPIANAGANQFVQIGTTVQLDGSQSTDVDGNPLGFQWSFVALPIGSGAVINNPVAVKPTFVADVAGTYIVQLVVNDSNVNSIPATVVITTNAALPPTANAGPNQSVSVGAQVQLAGSGTDPQNLPLSYSWSLISIPTGSAATLSSKTVPNPTFNTDVAGTYIAQLIVTDSNGLSSAPSTVTIKTSGTAPIANPGQNQTVVTGATVTLNGSGSTDSNGNKLSYSWTFTSIPNGSVATLVNPTSVSPSFVADLAGIYVVQLIVNDGVTNSAPRTVTITATPPGITLTPNPLNLVNMPGTVTVTVNPPAGGNGLTVNLSGFDANVVSAPSSVNIAGRASSATFSVYPLATGTTYLVASASGYQSGQTTVNVGSASITLSLSASGVGVGRSISGTVTLSSPAPAGGLTVALSSNPSNLVTFNPSSVVIAQGSTSGTFSVTGLAVGSANLTASATGYASGTSTLLVANLGVISLQKNVTVAPGQSSPLAITLSTPAPAGGVVVTLTSSDPTKVTVTPSVTIPAGAVGPTNPAQVKGVSFGASNITASATSYTSDTEAVTVADSISFAPNTLGLVAGSTANLTLNLSAASTSPITVTVSSSNTGVATVTPSTFTIAAGSTSVSIPVAAVAPGSSTITASTAGLANATASITVTGGGSISLPSGVSLTLGQSVAFPVTLSTPAPASGVVVKLSSSDPTKVTISPSSVNIVSGATTPATQPQITGVNFGAASITASASGYTSGIQSVSVKGSLTFSPTTLNLSSGTTQNLTLTLSTNAPTGGVTVSLSSSNTAAATVPSQVTIAAGTSSVSVPVQGIAGGSSTIAASAPGLASASASVTVTGGDIVVPATLSLSPGNTPTYNITLANAPAKPVTVTLSVSNTNVVTVSTTTVSFNAGSTTPTRPITLTAVGSGTATITASASGLTSAQTQVTVAQTATLTPQTLTISGVSGSGNLTLSLSSPVASPVTFTLTSSNTNVATVPQILPFTVGTQTLSFKVTGVGAGSTTIQASAPGYTPLSATVNVVQSGAIALSLGTSSIQLQNSTTLTVTLPGAAPFGGETVTLGTNNANISLSPTVVVIPQGSTTGTATVTGLNVGSASINATSPDFSAAQPVTIQIGATIAWASPTLSIPTLNTQVLEGLILSATVPRGATGIPVNVVSSNPSVATVQPLVTFFYDGSNMPTVKVPITSVGPGTTTITASGTNIPAVNLTVTVVGPVKITTNGLPNGVVNSAYSFTVQASGGTPPYTWSATNLPSPLSINPATGQITGTPTATSSNTVNIKVVDSTTPNATASSVTLPLTISAAVPTTLTAVAGTPQSAAVNTAFGTPLQVLLKDASGNPLSGATITFTAPTSGPSGTFTGGVTSTTAITDSTGKASAAFTANASTGSYSVTASINSLQATFSLTNTTGKATSIVATGGTPQSAQILTAFTALVATVKDAGNNPVPNVTVTFTAPASGASGTFTGGSNTATAITNASGVASAPTFTANKSLGSYSVTASVAGVANSATFSLTNTIGKAAAIAATSGTPQTAQVGTAFAAPLVATVTDAGNNPVSGVVVTFTAPASGASGTFAGGVNTATTNSSGVATSAVFTANGTVGPYTVTASVSGVTTTAKFSLSNQNGPAGSITATSGTPQQVQISKPFAALQATVKDSSGNPVASVNVTFTAPVSGATGTFSNGTNTITVATNASGVASATLTANKTAGSYSVTATTSGVATAASFSLTNLPGAAAAIAATSGSNQSAQALHAFASPFVATVTDAGGNPVSGVVVTFTAPTSGASGTFAGGVNTATTNASGVATSKVFTANSTIGGPYTVVASVSGVTANASFVGLSNTTGPAGSITATSGTPQSVAINSAFAALVATVKDSGGNPIPNVNVTFTAPATGASGTFSNSTNTITVATTSAGVASAAFTANKTVGSYSVTATTSGVAAAATFSLTNKTGPPAAVAATSGSGQTTEVNSAFASPLVATVTDAGGNPVSGVVVTFTAPTSGASGAFASGVNTATTNASGVATSNVFTANGTKGSYTVNASVSGVTTPATFSLTNQIGAPGSITATSGTPQSVAINTPFVAALIVVVKDSSGTPVPNVNVTFTAPVSGASGTFAGGSNTATVATNSSGVASAPRFTANKTVGSYSVSASTTGVASSATFNLTNLHGPAATITYTSGSGQSAQAGKPFASPLVATVTDAGGNPVNGVTVTFTAPTSGASATFAGGVNTATTSSTGAASVVVTANATAGGPYTITASVSSVSGTASFSLTNTNLGPGSITATSGTPQTVAISTAFASLVAIVKDADGNPVPNATVTFTAPASGASGTFTGGSNTATATTNSSGIATAPTFVANTKAGSYSVTASVTGAASPATFSLTNKAGSAAAITETSGSPQSASEGSAFASPLAVTVTDASNNPVSGVVVTFTAPSSGASGTFAGGVNTATTNSSGVATSGVFTANKSSGSYTVTAAVAGVTGTANFSLTNNPLGPASIAAIGGTPQQTAVNSAFSSPFQVLVKDANNNPLSGVTVTFTAPSAGASGTFPGNALSATAVTNAAGNAVSPTFTANGVASSTSYNVVASVSGLSATANFVLTNVPGNVSSITVVSGSGQTAQVNSAFASAFVVKVKDAAGNPISGQTVTFTPPTTGASGTFAGGANTARTDSTGTATSSQFTANTTAGANYNVVAAVGGVSANISLTNTAGSAASVTVVSGNNQTAQINTAFAAPFVVIVKDTYGNPVGGDNVTFTAPATTGPSGTFTGGATTATVATTASGTATSPVFTADSTKSPSNTTYTVTAALGSLSANFSLANLGGTPNSIAITAGNNQTTTVLSAFPIALAVSVADAGNNPIVGQTVTFTIVPSNGVTATFAGNTATAQVSTNASGIATAPALTAGSLIGTFSVTASISGTTLSASFTEANQAGPAHTITISGGNSQLANAGSVFTNPLQVTVTDVGGNPVARVPVTFAAPSTGQSATFSNSTNSIVVPTDNNGNASSGPVTANALQGQYSVTASVSGVTTPAAFSLTNVCSACGTISVTNATIGQNLQAPIMVTLNPPAPADGFLVSIASSNGALAVPGSSGKASETITLSAQTATFSVSIGALASSGTVTFTISAPNYNPVTSTITLAPSAFVISGPNGVGQPFNAFQGTATPLTVYSGYLDASGNYVANEPVLSTLNFKVAVPVSSSNTNAGTLQDCTAQTATVPCKSNVSSVTFTAGQGSYPLNLVASSTASAGTTTSVSAGAPSGFSTAVNGAVVATVQQAQVVPFNVTVGQNLQQSVSFGLNAPAPAGGVQYTLVSSDPTRILFGTDPTSTSGASAPSASMTIVIPPGHTTQQNAIWVQAVGGAAGNVISYTAQSGTAGFPDATGNITLAPSGIIITSFGVVGQPSFTENINDGPVQLTFSTYQEDGSGNPISAQLPQPGILPLTITLTDSDTTVGTISQPLPITAASIMASGSASTTATFTPVVSGSTTQTTIGATATGFTGANVLANVTTTTPPLLIGGTGQNDSVIGNGLQSLYQVVLGAAAPSTGLKVTVTNTSGNVLLSPDGVVPGAGSITLNVAAGKNTANFYVQGVQNSGGDTVNISAPGYSSTSAQVTLLNAGFVVYPVTATNVSLASKATVTLGISAELLNTDGSINSGTDEGPVGNVSIALTDSNAAAATVPASVSYPLSDGPTGITFTVTPVAVGTTTIGVTTPAGFTTPTFVPPATPVTSVGITVTP